MGRVEDHLGGRMRGRDIPDDLRRLAEVEFDGALHGRGSVQPFAEIHVLADGELHGLEDPQYLRDDEDAATIANGRALDDVLGHAAMVVDGFNGDLFGYWLHPDEPATDRPAIVKLDTEGQFDVLDGATLVEAMVFDWLGYDVDEDYLARIVEFCAQRGIPLAARDRDGLRKAQVAVDPGVLHDRLYRRYQPFTPCPAWADAGKQDSLVGLRITDAPLRAWLAQLGFPDPVATAEALDDGMGEVRLASPVAHVGLTFYQDQDHGWWLYSARFGRPEPERPLEVPLPYGFSLHDIRQAVRERFGPPAGSALLIPSDRWHFGPIVAHVRFENDEGLPKHIEFQPADVFRRS